MHIIVLTLTAKEGSDDGLASVLGTVAQASRGEPGCLRFEVYRGADEPREFTLVEHYVDAAALDAHRETPHFATAMEAIPGLVAERTGRVMNEVAPA